MKTKLSTLALLSMLAIATTSYGKINPVKDAVTVQNGTETDYQKFKREQEDKMRENDREIANLKAKMAKEDQSVRVKYDKKIEKMEEKNNDLKKKMANFHDEGNDTKWKAFKRDFSKSMDELGSSMKDLTKSYPK
jgi:uncharacterized protein HemX